MFIFHFSFHQTTRKQSTMPRLHFVKGHQKKGPTTICPRGKHLDSLLWWDERMRRKCTTTCGLNWEKATRKQKEIWEQSHPTVVKENPVNINGTGMCTIEYTEESHYHTCLICKHKFFCSGKLYSNPKDHCETTFKREQKVMLCSDENCARRLPTL